MLTTKTINPKQGESYYAKENYYSAEQSKEHSQWAGSGAAKLGLEGKVEPEDFKQLLHGALSNGEQFRTRKPTRTNYKERAGLDCTFNAPKSVSLLALEQGDKELEEAHRQAVEATLKILEDRYAQTRVRTSSGRQVVSTQNLVIGQFHHDTSRELDPHLHTHCVVLNATQLDNGKWYSLRDDDIHANKKLLGMIYQNELAVQVKRLGYEIEQKEHGQFEIKGFAPEHLEYFSKRREQIKSQLQENSTWAEREKIWDDTRLKKGEPLPRQELQDYWHREVKRLGIVYPQPGERQKSKVKSQNSHLKLAAEAITAGIEHCAERTAAFKPENIEKFVFSEVGDFSHAEVAQAITQSEELIHLDRRVTTQSALQRELSTIRLMHSGQGQLNAIAQPDLVMDYLENKKLTQGQQEAVVTATTTRDQFMAWQGVAGAGKTYALNEFRSLAENQGYTLKGLAPSSEAAKVLGEEVGIEAATVARHFHSKQPDRVKDKQIWIVDEAGLLSAKDAHDLLQRAYQEQARVILVGDTRQLSAVEAGNPFKSLQQAGMTTAYLNQSLRQRTQDLQQAVNLIANGQIEKGISHLDTHNRLAVIPDQQQRFEQLVKDYMAVNPAERDKTLVLAGTNAERQEITQKLRSALKSEGQLGKSAKLNHIKAKDLTAVQMRYAHNLAVGDVVMPLRNYKRRGLAKGELYEVVGKKRDCLTLKGTDGTNLEVDLGFQKAVYTQQEIEIAEWDKLKWTKNDHQLGRRNGQEFAVVSIEGSKASVQYPDGKFEEIDLSQPQHLDHAIVSTTYSSQGKTAERVLIAADSTIGKESFYVATSRVKHDLKLYTQNRADLVERAQKTRAKENPIELMRRQVREQVAQEALVGTPQTSTQANSPVKEGDNPKSKIQNQKFFTKRQEESHQELDSTPSKQLKSTPRDVGRMKQKPPKAIPKPAHQDLASLADHKSSFGVGQPLNNTNYLTSQHQLTNEGCPTPRHNSDQVRDISLEEVAVRLGLEQDHYDKQKWRGEAHIISLNGEKFYDHLEQKGGGGTIDLVMHVRDTSFKEAVQWLDNRAVGLPPVKSPTKHQQDKAVQKKERKPFSPPVSEESKWDAVQQYLVEKRGLPESLVTQLHQQGTVYADERQNAVFLRKNLDEQVTGANLRGTYNDSQFKGLASGTRRDEGWFSLAQGEGELKRIVLVESPIDALSAATLAQKPEKTLFLSTDGAGSIPHDFLKRESERGTEVMVAYDADPAGEEMAQRVLEELTGAVRIKPPDGKDWNEQLLRVNDNEARETARAVGTLLRELGERHSDGSATFEGNQWQFNQQGDTVTITVKSGNREILRVNGDTPVTFDPNREERERLRQLREDVRRDYLQQQQPEPKQQRRRLR